MVLAYLNEPPFCWKDAAGEVVGLDIEVAFTVLKALGIESVETRLAAFADFIPGVAAGAWTINVPMFVTPERAKRVAFSRPVWSLADGLMMRAHDPRTFASYEAVGRQETAVIGVIAGQIQHDAALRAGIPVNRLKVFSAPEDAIEALLAGGIDAYASAAMVHRGLLRERRDERLRVADFDDTAGEPALGAYSFALSNVELLTAFNRQLASFLGSPQHLEIAARYGFTGAEMACVNPINLTLT